jgi:hypothetical protein
MMNPDGSEVVQLTDKDLQDSDPAWQPNARTFFGVAVDEAATGSSTALDGGRSVTACCAKQREVVDVSCSTADDGLVMLDARGGDLALVSSGHDLKDRQPLIVGDRVDDL